MRRVVTRFAAALVVMLATASSVQAGGVGQVVAIISQFFGLGSATAGQVLVVQSNGSVRPQTGATPAAHASTHNAGGSDALAIDAAAGTGSLRTLGTSATSACAGSDARLSDSRTPSAHNVLSTAHGDTTAATLVRGDLLVVDSTGTLVRLPKGAANAVVGMNSAGTDVAWISSTVGIQATLPSSISGLQLWVDAQDSTKYTLSGTDVLTITDKSSNANVLATSASGGFVRPVLTSNAINGHTAFLMGSSHQIASTGISGGALNGFTLSHIGDAYAVISITTWGASRTVFALGTTVSASTNSGIVWRAQGSTQTGPSLFRRENGSDTETQNTGNFSSFPGASTGYLMRWTADRGGCTMGLNRAALPGVTTTIAGWTSGVAATATVRAIALGEYVLGGTITNIDAYGQIMTGYIGEVCVFNRRLSDEERMGLEKYLSSRWGTP
jgi:hypothetical protein